MCGIAGFAGNFPSTMLMQMGISIAHRGPDDAGEKFISLPNQHIGLAHRRLAIIDLTSDAHQPMTVNCHCCQSRPNQLWLVFNGEIYNFQQLRQTLIEKGHRFTSVSDSEVLLHLYAEDGVAMLKKLNGIFTFAIYDGRTRRRDQDIEQHDLFIARDGQGIKPLYYAENQDGFLFASELKALLATNTIAKQLDYNALHYYLAYLWCPGERTPITTIKKCLPGEALIVRNKKIQRKWFYYDLPYQAEIDTKNEFELAEELNVHLKNAVQRQLMADVPIGAFLSGGLDSSAIVSAVRQLYPEQSLRCYTIGLKDGMRSEGHADDLPYAKKVAKHLGVDLHIINVDSGIHLPLEKMIYHLDEPQADPAPMHVYAISQAAKQDGVKVLLSGAGGDDIFSGYRRHRALQLEKYWTSLPDFIRSKCANYANQLMNGDKKSSRQLQRISKLFAYADLSNQERLAHYFVWNAEKLRRNLYSESMRAAVNQLHTIAPLLETLKRIPHEKDAMNQMLYLEGKHFLPDHNLNYTDKMSMALGVEVRVPLLDPDMIQFATKIPSKYKQKGQVGKAIFKKSMEKYLPHDVIYRPKTGFGAPVRKWIHHDLKPMINDIFSSQAFINRDIFNPTAVFQLIDWDKSGRVDAAYTIFSILCIELWCKTFIDKNVIGSP